MSTWLKSLFPKIEFLVIFISITIIVNGAVSLFLLFNIQNIGDRQRATAIYLEQTLKYELAFKSEVNIYSEAIFFNNTRIIRDDLRNVIVDDLWNRGEETDTVDQLDFKDKLAKQYNVSLEHFAELAALARDQKYSEAQQKWQSFVPDFDKTTLLLTDREKTLKAGLVAANQDISSNIIWSVVLLMVLTCLSLLFTLLLRVLVRFNRKAEDEIIEREEQYRSIFENSSGGLLIFDPRTCKVVEANQACYELYGCSSFEEFAGYYPASFLDPDYRNWFYSELATITGPSIKTHFNTQKLRKDGKIIFVEKWVTGLRYRGKTHLLLALRDVTEKTLAYQLLEQRVEERTKELSTLLQVSHDVAATLELKPLVNLVLDQLKQLIEYDGALILAFQEENFQLLEERSPYSENLPGKLTKYLLERDCLTLNSGLRDSVIINSLSQQKDLQAFLDPLYKNDGEKAGIIFESWLGLPLVVKERAVGFLSLFHRQPGYYSPNKLALATAVANQAAIALENARLYEQAQEIAILEERQRIARELHDSTSQVLFSILLGARTTLDLLERKNPDQLQRPLEYIKTLAEGGLDEMRTLIFALRNNSVAEEGLIPVLIKQIYTLQSRHGVTVELELDEGEPEIPLKLKNQIYWILREALNNVVKHSRATSVRLKIRWKDLEKQDAMLIELHDNGVGFDSRASFPGHIGLQTMRERVTRQGGLFRIESSPGAGTSLYFAFPFNA